MHVSPFNPMEYALSAGAVTSQHKMLTLHLETEMRRRNTRRRDHGAEAPRDNDPTGAGRAILLQHPWMTAKVAVTIYWQAVETLVQAQPDLRSSRCSTGKTGRQ